MMAISTPLGKDYLVLRSFTAQEGISRLFSFELDLLSEDSAIQFKDIIGQRVTIRVTLSNMKERYFNGFISRFAQIGCDTGQTTYRATMVPWLWFLTQTTDCRIFQNKTVPDIIQQIFKEYGFTDLKVKLQKTYEPREYCVQYRETDYNFVVRLMEQYGIFYFFEHEKEKHTLILADDPSAHDSCPEKDIAHWQLPGGGVAPEEDVVTSLQMEQLFRPGKCTLSDYCFETPNTSLLSEVKTTIDVGGNGTYELYDYPGEYAKKKEGEALARLRMEEEEAKHLCLNGTSNCRAFTSGYRFKLVDYGRHDMDQEYILTEVRHKASLGDSYASGGGGSEGDEDYTNEFTCLPHKVAFRASPVTPKPVIHGSQTAVVVGPAGEEIYTDKQGRVKVQFHWDREGKRNEDSSCWIRVSQVHAGKGFGGVDIPRIGEEVIVGFLEGSPDQPIIIGRVYNGQNAPPNGLPAAGMVSGLKSNSTPGGGGNNAIMMNDTKGQEKFDVNAQHDMSTTVGNDHSLTVVGGNDTHTVSAGTRTVTVKGNTSLTVQAGDRIVDVTGNYKCDTTSEVNVQAPTKITLTCGGSTITMEPGKITMNAGGGASIVLDANAFTIASGGAQLLLDANANMQSSGGSSVLLDGNATVSGAGEATVEAATKSTLSGGGATVVNDAGGVAVTGPKISLNG
jgi:type VI secretion system secreted protein VgrG